MTQIGTIEKTDILPDLDDDVSDPDGFAHYTRITGLMQGGVQVALCGKKWVPKTIEKAADFPICPKCADLMEFIKQMDEMV